MYVQPRELISGMRRWWQSWRQANSSLSELVCCGEYEAERMAHDLGLPVSELRKLAEHGPEAADLLTRRMAELNLDRNEVAAAVPRTLQDLQLVCTMCEKHRQCARDLERDPADQVWEDYCPNVAVLKMLNALPWVARSEW
jgi:folate-dependent tRNA-U54 methylase TrmFO/GidA